MAWMCGGLWSSKYMRITMPKKRLISGICPYPTTSSSSTPQDAVFLFPDAARSLDPGIFRAEALRAVYVDWKSGGQANYLQDFGDEWWSRWQQTMAHRFTPADLPKYEALGIGYMVLQSPNRLPQPALFDNAKYAVISVTGYVTPKLR